MSRLDELKQEVLELEAKAKAAPENQQADGQPAPPAEGVLWHCYVQGHLETIMDEQRPLAERVVMARSVLGRYQREAYLPGYQVTDQDRKLLAEVVGRIKSATQPDGITYRSITGSVWS